jgi:phenylpropionate dioxygenase-like ring-hydroxylating dioxygenase large terminal subunit
MATQTTIGIEEDVTQRIVNHLTKRTKDVLESDMRVPMSHFVDPARTAAEIALMKRLPLVVAHRSELPNPGDFVTRTALGIALIVARRNDGSVVTFRNMCRHRGGRVEGAASGNKPTFACTYHGWSYDREDGALKYVAQEEVFGSLDRQCLSLVAFPSAERHGLIFVTLTPGVESSIAEYLGPQVDAQIAPWGLDRSVLVMEKTFSLAANWKLIVDGAVDSLHPPYLHPDSVAKLVYAKVAVFCRYGRHGRLYQPKRKLQELLQAGTPPASSTKYVSSILLLYPNSLMASAPDHVEFWTVWPSLDSPSQSTIHIRLFARPEILTPEMRARIQKSWDILVTAQETEDWPMELAIQENALSSPTGSFIFGRGEISAQHLHQQLKEDIDGVPYRDTSTTVQR